MVLVVNIKNIIESGGAKFRVEGSNTLPIDTYQNRYFEIRSDLVLTEFDNLFTPGKSNVTTSSIYFLRYVLLQ